MANYGIDAKNIKGSIYEIKAAFLYSSKETLKYLLDRKVNLEEVFDIFDRRNIYVNFNIVAESLIELNQEKIIEKYLNYFLRENTKILEFKNIIKDTKIDINMINKFINNNKDSIIIEIAGEDIDYLKEEKLYNFFKILIEELLENENKKYSDIELIGEGGFSKVFGIGGKVLKVGDKRQTYKIKNNKLFLKPLYRTSIETNYRYFCIEITEKVDTENITDEDVYQVYKQLRDDGILWDDAKKTNIGRLLKDNKIYFDGVDFVDKESTGYTTDNFEILKKGSLVLLDADHLYDVDEFFENWDYDFYCKNNSYEKRYRKEKNSKLNR